jgi:hypothetical protein
VHATLRWYKTTGAVWSGVTTTGTKQGLAPSTRDEAAVTSARHPEMVQNRWGGVERSDKKMDWNKEYQIDDSGGVTWHESMSIHDAGLRVIYIGDSVMQLVIQNFAERGVKVGAA